MQARRVLPRKSRQHEGPHDCRLEEVLLLIENPRWTPFFGIKDLEISREQAEKRLLEGEAGDIPTLGSSSGSFYRSSKSNQ